MKTRRGDNVRGNGVSMPLGVLVADGDASAAIRLGRRVRCKITGFAGIAVIRQEHLNGRIQYTVCPPMGPDGRFPGSVVIDEEQLEAYPGR